MPPFSMPPLLPPPQITTRLYQITARAIFYSADGRLWHLTLLGLPGEPRGCSLGMLWDAYAGRAVLA